MEAKRTIDPTYYGINGYGNVPSYNIPNRATGHLMYHPARETHEALCGAPAGNLHDRKVKDNRAWKKVCARCTKVAESDGLVEWKMLPLRKGDCPVLSERVGKRTKHILNAHRPRCKNCPEQKRYNHTERCSKRHNTFARCNSCGYNDVARHYCDFIVGRSMGISTDFGPCNKGATEQRLVPDRYHQPDSMVWHYLCKQHLPESIQARTDAADEKYRAWSAAADAKNDARVSQSDAFDILVELACWVAKNREIAAEDEWLGQIAVKLAENDAVQAAIEGEADG